MQTILLQHATDAYGISSDFLIQDGIIAKRAPAGALQDAADVVIPAKGLTIFPGLFDMHVHLRDPGFTQKEDILTGAAAKQLRLEVEPNNVRAKALYERMGYKVLPYQEMILSLDEAE